ncbi:MAG: T9SS type A sorting domain-containing protein, partial [Bacteroidetes bacterium]|nr:T9SS type A sorting domain-containing protein [Bacteroidota bacterium]
YVDNGSYDRIVQYDLTQPSDSLISKSESIRLFPFISRVNNNLKEGFNFLTTDNNHTNINFGIVSNTDTSIQFCNFQSTVNNILPFDGSNANALIPTFSHYYYQRINFSYEQTFQDMPCIFKAYSCFDSTTFEWDFGDTASSVLNTSSMKYPVHIYKDSGTYKVRCIKHRYDQDNDTMIKTIHIQYNPKSYLGKDTALCAGQNIILTSPYIYDKYLWSNGDTTKTITVNASGIYILNTYKYYAGSCDALEVAVNADTITINIVPNPQKITQHKYYVCVGKTVTITAENTGMKYLWNTNDTIQQINVAQGKYIVKISNLQCFIYDTFEVVNFNTFKPAITIQNNQLASTKGNTYKWFNADTLVPNESKQQFEPKHNGYYKVLITDSNGCEAISDSIYFERIFAEIKIYPNPSNNVFTIELPNGNNEEYTLELYDAIGRRLQLKYSTKEGVTNIDLGDYASASYLLKITNTSGNSWVKKIIKQ